MLNVNVYLHSTSDFLNNEVETMSKLLINEPPLQVLPSLAVLIGLNEALILQQIHYWIDPRINKNLFDGRLWVHNKYEDWQRQFPFWSEITIRRTMKELEKQQLISCRMAKSRFDRVKFYTVNYDVLSNLTSKCVAPYPTDQYDQMDRSIRSDGPINMTSVSDQNDQSIYKDTETTLKKTLSISLTGDEHTKQREMISIWNKIVSPNGSLTLTPKRSEILAKRLISHFDGSLSEWEKYCQKITSSEFLMGEVTKFKASLDWCLEEDKITRILEGDYGVGDREVCSEPLVEKKEEDLEIGDDIWSRVKIFLKARLGEGTYSSWIRPLTVEALTAEGVVLKAPSRFNKDYITAHLLGHIKEAFSMHGMEGNTEVVCG